MSHRRYLVETNRALRAMGVTPSTPLVSTARELARMLDVAGPEGPSARLLAQHQSVLREIRLSMRTAGKLARPLSNPGSLMERLRTEYVRNHPGETGYRPRQVRVEDLPEGVMVWTPD